MSQLGQSRFFPAIDKTDVDGLVLVGGELTTEWLLDAYRHGIFPWPVFEGVRRMQWWSPDPRAIFEFDSFHVSRRLARTCRGERFTITSDRDFAGVIQGCATAGDRRLGTWLTRPMIAAYQSLHDQGHVHSVEVWHDEQLAGGVYGVALGGFFAAESMFHTVRDASKVALARLVGHLQQRGYQLFDIQQLTPHTARLGAVEIPRATFLRRLAGALAEPATFGRIEDGTA